MSAKSSRLGLAALALASQVAACDRSSQGSNAVRAPPSASVSHVDTVASLASTSSTEVAVQAPTTSANREKDSVSDTHIPSNEQLAFRLKQVVDWQQRRLTGVALADLPEAVRAESEVWTGRVFRPGARPFENSSTEFAVLSKSETLPDVLTYSWAFEELQLRGFETGNNSIVLLCKLAEPIGTDADGIREQLGHVAQRLFQRDQTFSERTPSAAEGGLAFSTAPGQRVVSMAAWHDRVDAGTVGEHLFFVVYKRKSQILGFETDDWFPEQFRQRIRAHSGEKSTP